MTLSPRAYLRAQELCAASLRALARDPALQLRGGRVVRAGVVAAVPPAHLRPSPEHDDLRSFRAAADGLALRQLHTDPDIHQQQAPADPAARRLFDLLEQYRVESLVPDELPGVRENLLHRHQAWTDAFASEGLLDSENGILVYAVAQTCRSRVTGVPLHDPLEDKIEPVRIQLAPLIGAEMAALRRLRHDQQAYAVPAALIATRVAELLHAVQAMGSDKKDEQQAGSRKRGLSLWIDEESEADNEVPIAGLGASRLLEDGADSYRAYTRAYDAQLDAASLVRAEQLQEFRLQLDQSVAKAGVNFGRLGQHLQALFAYPAEDGWNSAQEEGRIDGRLLAQLVASPTERRLFKQPRTEFLADCCVTFLLDCSGSMKQHAPRLALLVDVFARALEQAGITSEVLGFTTRAWNGGRARRDWLRGGSAHHPGRLNEVAHLVFKPAEESWRRRRRAIAALLKTELFREGVDGEAVDWACQRLRQRPERRRVLVVVSDGSPMDGATSLANDPHYLDHHLQAVVAAQSAAGGLEIRALGVGLDLSPYYDKSLVLDLSQPPTIRSFLQVGSFIAGRPVLIEALHWDPGGSK